MIKTENQFPELLEKLSRSFGEDLDLTSLLFLIGLQELGMSHEKLSKDQKIDVLHIAICKLLEPHGYYNFIGRDIDGWPHWEIANEIPDMLPKDQLQLIRSAITNYFKENNP
jgi:hypothetical protein